MSLDLNFILQPLVIGLLGSFHCLGMCGPIVIAVPLKGNTVYSRMFSSLLYNSGRVITYSVMGYLFGLLGLGLHIWGIQQWVSIGMGTLMILSVAFPLLFGQASAAKLMEKPLGVMTRSFSRLFGLGNPLSVLLIGLLNGLLPCGLVYIALAGALLTTTPVQGAVYMMLFGLGTIPALLGLSMAGYAFGSAIRQKIRGVLPFLVLLIGILFILRGMNLGIPYLSPKMEGQASQVKTEEFQKPECCH